MIILYQFTINYVGHVQWAMTNQRPGPRSLFKLMAYMHAAGHECTRTRAPANQQEISVYGPLLDLNEML
jgi:hypothetical protein